MINDLPFYLSISFTILYLLKVIIFKKKIGKEKNFKIFFKLLFLVYIVT